MGFVEKILKFFSGFFGSSEKIAKVNESDLDSFLEKIVLEQENELKKQLAIKFSEVKHLIKEINETIYEIEKTRLNEEEGNPQLRKIVNTSKGFSTRQLKSLAEKLNPPNIENIEAVKSYCWNSNALLEKEIMLFGRNIAYTSILLKEEMKKLGEYFSELQKIFIGLKQEISSKNAILSNAQAKKLLKELTNEISLVENAKKDLQNIEKETNVLKNENEAIESELNKLNNSIEFNEINEIRSKKSELFEEKQKLKTKVLELLANVERPLKKFKNLAEQQQVSLNKNQLELLNAYLINPFSALKTDIKAEELKKILAEAKKAIEENKIELEHREREKRLNAIGELISFDFFENVFWKMNQIDVQINAVEEQLNSKTVLRKIQEIEAKKRQIERELFEKNSAKKMQNDSIERNKKIIENLREEIKEIASNIAGKNIEIEW